MNILIIAGHGQGDPGACANGYKESELVRELSSSLQNTLRQYATVDLFDTTRNMYKYLKTYSFDFKKYDYVFEVHFNSCVNDTRGNGKTTGTEILVHTSENGTTVEELILENMKKIGFTNRGVEKKSNLQNMNVCKGLQGVSYALLETCFIDDIDDMKLYISNKEKVVSAVSEGIINGFGLKTTDKFADIAECYGKKDIIELAEMGIINGRGDGTFAPKEPVTREDVAIMIRRAIKYITGK